MTQPNGDAVDAATHWTRICRASAVGSTVPLGREVSRPGEEPHRVCVAERADGTPVALWDRCPHRDIALSGGRVRDGVLTCPGHFWRFDLTTGQRLDLPEDVVTLYATRVVDGWVEAALPRTVARLPMREWLLQQARLP